MSQSEMLTAALEYHSRGWSVIPIPYGKKKAFIKWSMYQKNRPDENQLRKWFGGRKKNMAVVLGEVSGGLACRDFDTVPEYDQWTRNYPDLAKMLPTVKTARGMHVYFEGHIEGIKHIANGELRGSGGYCLLPPSLHPDRVEYEWINPVFNGNLLCIDPKLAGFIPTGTEQTEKTEHTEAIREDRGHKGVRNEKLVVDVSQIINETLPKAYGTRNRQIFEFARALKSLPQYADADAKDFRDIVKQWYKLALPKIRTKEFEETWIDFLKAWSKIKYPKGKEPMAIMFQRAISLEPPQLALKLYPDNRKLLTLASVCRELQKASGTDPFFLAVRTAAKYLDVDPKTANRYLFLFCTENLLELVQKGGTVENPRKASRYKFIAN